MRRRNGIERKRERRKDFRMNGLVTVVLFMSACKVVSLSFAEFNVYIS